MTLFVTSEERTKTKNKGNAKEMRKREEKSDAAIQKKTEQKTKEIATAPSVCLAMTARWVLWRRGVPMARPSRGEKGHKFCALPISPV